MRGRRANQSSSAQHREDQLQDAADQAASETSGHQDVDAHDIAADQAAIQAQADADQEVIDAQIQADAQAAEALAADELEAEDPAAKRQSLLARVNAHNIEIERKKRVSKGLLILQSKTLPFEIEDV